MKKSDLDDIQRINEQLEHMKDMGLIEDYIYTVGDSLETSDVKLSIREGMIPFVFGNQEVTVH